MEFVKQLILDIPLNHNVKKSFSHAVLVYIARQCLRLSNVCGVLLDCY